MITAFCLVLSRKGPEDMGVGGNSTSEELSQRSPADRREEPRCDH